MSNVHVGQVYEAVIQGVIDAVRVDFEENGVEDGVLEDLKKVRQTRIPVPVSLPACVSMRTVCRLR